MRVSNLIRGVILGAFLFLAVALTGLAAVSTSYITSDGVEHTYFVADSLFINVVVLAAVVAALFALRKPTEALRRRINSDTRTFTAIKACLLAIEAVIGVVWILGTQAIPGSDALFVQNAVADGLSGDYSTFANDAYMGTYRNQFGLYWISRAFALVFGPNNYLAFELFNVAGAVVAIKVLADLAGMLGASNTTQLATLLTAILFFPMLQYASFVYGIVWGLALSLVAVKHEFLFFEKRRWSHALASAVAICLAMTFKSNYQVFFIAMLLYALAMLLRERSARAAAAAVLLVAAFAIQALVPVGAARAVSGYPIDQGCSSWSWVAMGFQESERAPGWYNKFNKESYQESDYTTADQAAIAQERIGESMTDFVGDPQKALEFFTLKTASQWNNPSFQGFWNVQVRSSLIDIGDTTKAITSAQGADTAAHYLDRLQFLILAGAVLWAVLTAWTVRRKQGKGNAILDRQVMLPLIFIGGFVCHLFWEGKCQYTLPYFELLIPLAAMGFAMLIERIDKTHHAKQTPLARPATGEIVAKSIPIALALVLALVTALSPADQSLTADGEAYAAYLDSNPSIQLADGTGNTHSPMHHR